VQNENNCHLKLSFDQFSEDGHAGDWEARYFPFYSWWAGK
jgi:hypothetical protein